MSMFDYGRNKQASKQDKIYTYQYLKPELQDGFYPTDGYQGSKKYDEPRMSELNKPAYGEVYYSRFLSEDDCFMYNLVQVETVQPTQNVENNVENKVEKNQVENQKVEEPKVKQEEKPIEQQKQQVVETQSENQEQQDVVLHNVRKNRIFDSKNNSNCKLISMRDSRSDTNHSNYLINVSDMSQNADGTYDIILGKKGQIKALSVIQNGEPAKIQQTVDEIKDLYEHTLVTNVNTNKNAKNAYLNKVDIKFVQETSNPNYKVVSIPVSREESDNGFMKYTAPSKNIFNTRENGKVVPYHVNVNLGPEDNMIFVKVKKDGKFSEVLVKASELSERQDAAVKQYESSRAKKDVEKQRAQRVDATVQKLGVNSMQNTHEDEMVLQ